MTGLPLFNRHAFMAAESDLQERSPECTIFNPINAVVAEPTWENFMREDIAMLLECEAIYMLKGWKESRGATLELTIATALGMRVIYEC
jgi:hypothetical protein